MLRNLRPRLLIVKLLPEVGNLLISDNILIKDGLHELEARLPRGWEVGPLFASTAIDAMAEIRSPDQRTAALGIEAQSRLTPKIATDVVRRFKEAEVAAPLVVSNFVSAATAAVLRGNDVSFVDLTGNIRLVLSNPGLFIETTGASENPEKEQRTGSLKGTKAGRVVRTLVELKEPLGVRDLAAKTGVDAGYVSRLFSFLDAEALITRVGRGRLDTVAWPQLLERWATDAPFASRGRITTFIDPRGTASVLEKLRASSRRYAITGSFAATRFAPISPSRLLAIYTDDASGLIADTDLRHTTSGANVQLVEPADEEVFRGLIERNGLRYAALPQIVVDLMTGPGRAPAEAEELVEWMRENEDAWRG